MKAKSASRSAFFNLRSLVALLPCAAAACSISTGTMLAFFRPETRTKISRPATAGLTFAARASYQRAIEEVYWRHRIWPNERPDPKPALDAVMSQAQLEKKVENYLRNSQALEDYSQRPIAAERLQAEIDRMAQHTKQPEVLHELFEALGNDPFVIAECLARPVLTERLFAELYAHDQTFHGELKRSWLVKAETQAPVTIPAASANYTLPVIASPSGGCTDDTWTSTSTTNAPSGRLQFTAVWTGSEMIVWGGLDNLANYLNSGGRYNPNTDSWTATSTTGAPAARDLHTAVWTGSEMIVWGGSGPGVSNTGGRYNPSTDTWTATSTIGAPVGRTNHTAVWTGSEMIVWGGLGVGGRFNTGGRYNPGTDSWTATSTTSAPTGRDSHTAVWTGSEMIVWGGAGAIGPPVNTGGRYNPSTDGWTPTTTIGAPAGRYFHTAVWTDSQMIVWGGTNSMGVYFNTGGRYNPSTDGWTPSTTTGAPEGRITHTAVWTGSQMIVWGGYPGQGVLNTGGRYNPSTDNWMATNTTNAPDAREYQTAIWVGTGSEMIVWGGWNFSSFFNTGGRYCAAAPSPTPTATPTATFAPTSTPTATATPTSTSTPRGTPTPRPRPTPALRP